MTISQGDKKRIRKERQTPEYLARVAERERVKRIKQEAADSGDTVFFSGVPCPSGHTGARFLKGGKCVECNRILCLAKHERRIGPERREELTRQAIDREERRAKESVDKACWRAAANARKEARASGAITYISQKECPNGHAGERYLSTGMCVQCAADKSASDEKKEYDREYNEKNKDRRYAQMREYRESRSSELVEKAKRWSAANPEKRKLISKHYKARRRAQEEGGATFSEIESWESGAVKVCHWCGVKCADKYHLDHYHPLSKGGKHTVDNFVIACPDCNLRKSAKDPYQFAASMGRLF